MHHIKWREKLTIKKTEALLKVIYKFNTSPFKISIAFCTEFAGILKFLWKTKQLREAKTDLKKTDGGIELPYSISSNL